MGSVVFDPELRIFLSVDLVGSTAFKQRKVAVDREGEKPNYHSWVFSFSGFYSDFGKYYLKALERESHNLNIDTFEVPKVWKRLGDELIFTVQLKESSHVFFYVKCFRRALVDFEATLKKQMQPLKVKGTAWVAGFPVRNVRLKENENEGLEEYIGPCIDLGFRLTKFSTSRKFVLSVDLVWLILLQRHDINDTIEIYYDGKVPIKGFTGDEYPIFWILKSVNKENDKELALLHLEHCANENAVVFCEDFIRDKANNLQLPFILNDKLLDCYKPDDYSTQCEMVERLLQDISLFQSPAGANEDRIIKESPDIINNIFEKFLSRKKT